MPCVKSVILGINLAKLNSTVKGGCFLTRESISLVIAGEGGLIKDGSVAADEAPVSSLHYLSSIILQWQADVEDLAGIVDISIVTIGLGLIKLSISFYY